MKEYKWIRTRYPGVPAAVEPVVGTVSATGLVFDLKHVPGNALGSGKILSQVAVHAVQHRILHDSFIFEIQHANCVQYVKHGTH